MAEGKRERSYVLAAGVGRCKHDKEVGGLHKMGIKHKGVGASKGAVKGWGMGE